jgi:hypothetical protein
MAIYGTLARVRLDELKKNRAAVAAPSSPPTPAGVAPQTRPNGKIGLDREPPPGTLPYGKKALVDDGTCPPEQIKQITGGDNNRGIGRARSCIPR